MTEDSKDPLLLMASEAELPAAHRVWGTGGWLPSEQREALDGLTLSRFLGWSVTVTRWTSAGLDRGSLMGVAVLYLPVILTAWGKSWLRLSPLDLPLVMCHG